MWKNIFLQVLQNIFLQVLILIIVRFNINPKKFFTGNQNQNWPISSTILSISLDVISLVKGASSWSKSRPLVCVVRHSPGSLALSTKRCQSNPSRITVKIIEETKSSTVNGLKSLVHGDAHEATSKTQNGKFYIATETDKNESKTIVHRWRTTCDQLDVFDPKPANSL